MQVSVQQPVHLTADGACSDVGVLRPNEVVQFLDSKFKSSKC